jgi:hypothetical protein
MRLKILILEKCAKRNNADGGDRINYSRRLGWDRDWKNNWFFINVLADPNLQLVIPHPRKSADDSKKEKAAYLIQPLYFGESQLGAIGVFRLQGLRAFVKRADHFYERSISSLCLLRLLYLTAGVPDRPYLAVIETVPNFNGVRIGEA